MEPRSVEIIPEIVHILIESLNNGYEDFLFKSRPTIYMVPSRLRDLSPNSFTPRNFSIGPLHKQDENVQELELHKPLVIDILLTKLHCPPSETMKACAEKVNARLDDIRRCYGVLTYSDVELAKMMVMDACFILGILNGEMISHYKGNKAVSFISDLVLLENQIPFFVLQDIFECTFQKSQPTADLNKMLLNILKVVKPFETELYDIDTGLHVHHILHFLHSSYQPPTYESKSDDSFFVPPCYPIRELEKAGVSFKRNEDYKWALAINFKSSWREATLTLPFLTINEYTELVFSNLIAFEQSHIYIPSYFTSYVIAMMNLLEAKEDHVKLLDLKIARNNPSGSQYVVDLIRTLSKASDRKDFLYVKDWDKMSDYCNSRLGRTRRTYFSGAWSYVASTSGLILFILTIIQTYCAIRGK